MFPGLRGLSERSVRRFCTDRGISRRCSLTKEELERCVSDAVSEVSTKILALSFWVAGCMLIIVRLGHDLLYTVCMAYNSCMHVYLY